MDKNQKIFVIKYFITNNTIRSSGISVSNKNGGGISGTINNGSSGLIIDRVYIIPGIGRREHAAALVSYINPARLHVVI